MAAALPEGLVTLVFTDIEGSTKLLHALGNRYGEVLADHHRLLRGVWSAHGGVEVDTEGDAFFVAFASARRAVEAVEAAQAALDGHAWPHGGELRVRMGVHSGEPQQRDGTYWGIDIHYAARLCSAAHGGQVLLSAATRGLVPDAPVEDLGEHALKDFPAPRSLFHLITGERRATDFPPPRTLSSTRTNLPSLSTPLVGREPELAGLVRRLTLSPERLVTLTGAGGSGKTKLAIACGTELLEQFEDGVYLVPLAGVTEASGVGLALLDALDPPRHPLGLERTLSDFLGPRRLLLLVDNFEHVLDAAPFIGRLLEGAPRLRVLATSQAPLRLAAESILPLDPLPVPEAGELEPERLAAVPAVALFAERARAADPAFSLTADNAGAVAALCRALDGLPLALELAAARVRMAGVQGVLDALGRGIDALGRGSRDLPARQRGLRAALDFTVSLLEDDARALFPALGAFADAWTIEEAEALLDGEVDVWEGMASLLDLSLIRARGDGRFTMAERVKAHARELLAGSGQETEIRRRHATIMAELAERLDWEECVDHKAATARARDAAEEIEHALSWSRSSAPDLHRRLIGAIGRTFWFSGRLPALAGEIERLAAAETGEDAVGGGVLIARAMLECLRGDGVRAAEWTARAVECHKRTADGPQLMATLAVNNHMLTLAGDGPGARAAIADSLALAAHQPDPRYASLFEATLAFAAVAEERYDEAEERLRWVLARPGSTDFAAVGASTYLADCALGRGDAPQALERYLEETEECLARQDRPNALLQLCGVAASLAMLGRDREAARVAAGVAGVSPQFGWQEPWAGVAPVTRELAQLVDRIGEAQWGTLRAEGAALSFEELVELARATSPALVNQ